MKKLLNISILLLIAATLCAQKLKIDDGTISIDKVPIAKIEGESGLFKGIDLTYKSLDGQPLFRLKLKSSNYFIPTHESLWWYDIEFFKPAVRVNYLPKEAIKYSEKKMSEWLFITIDPKLLKNNEIDTAALRTFIAANDASEKIKLDTLAYAVYEATLINQLITSKITRDTKKPIICKELGSDGFYTTKTTLYDILQDGVVLAKIEKTIDKSSTSYTGTFKVYKKYTQPLEIDGKSFTEGLAAFVKVGNYGTITTIQDKKHNKVEFTIGENSQQQIAEFLVAGGYL